MKNIILISLLITIISVTSFDGNVAIAGNKKHNRQKRGGFKFWSFFETIGNMKSIYDEQYNHTVVSLNRIYDILADSFSDTYTTTKPPPTTTIATTTSSASNETTTMPTTTEKYRISRYELGVIGNRNLRGLKKLLRIELNDAFNQSKYNVRDYQREIKNAVAQYATFDNINNNTKFGR